jgi:hypothetical protein
VPIFPPRVFAYVADTEKPATWLLPLNSAENVRAAVTEFEKTEMKDAKKKSRAWRRLVAAARKHSIEIAEIKAN